jgi:3-oxoacyl-[acyl-carrier-protein] synthase III
MKQLVRSVKVIGTGSFVPERIVTNKELEKTIDTNATKFTMVVKYNFDYDIQWEKLYDDNGDLVN